MAKKKKKRLHVRTRDWTEKHEFAYTHDRVKHRRAVPSVSDAAPQAPLPASFEPNAVVIAHAKKWAFVQCEGTERLCRIDERLVEEDATLLAPGDRVLVEYDNKEAVVRGVAPRRTRLSRPAPGYSRVREQVLAANVDLLLVVASVAQPPFRPGLVDRYLIASRVNGVPATLCINKMDLVESPPPEIDIYRELGIPVFPTSCLTGQGIDDLRTAMRGKTAVLSGHSGVGKSSLLNAMDPNLRLVTEAVIAATGRGKHATTSARLYELAGDIRVIDTPGIRAMGLWGVSAQEVAYYFPELAEAARACRFHNCTHTHEPVCGVREAVEQGRIPKVRYDSYLRIRASLEAGKALGGGRIST